MSPDLIRWLSADWTHAVTAAGLLALGYASRGPRSARRTSASSADRMPRTRLVLVLDILADLAVNVPGRSTGCSGHRARPLFLPAPPAPGLPPPRLGAWQAGRATVAALVLLALVGVLGTRGVPAGARAVLDTQSPGGLRRRHPALPRRRPEVCSRAGRWWASLPRSPSGEPRRCADVRGRGRRGGCRSSAVVTP